MSENEESNWAGPWVVTMYGTKTVDPKLAARAVAFDIPFIRALETMAAVYPLANDEKAAIQRYRERAAAECPTVRAALLAKKPST